MSKAVGQNEFKLVLKSRADAPFPKLPDVLILHIVQYGLLSDVWALLGVCRAFRQAILKAPHLFLLGQDELNFVGRLVENKVMKPDGRMAVLAADALNFLDEKEQGRLALLLPHLKRANVWVTDQFQNFPQSFLFFERALFSSYDTLKYNPSDFSPELSKQNVNFVLPLLTKVPLKELSLNLQPEDLGLNQVALISTLKKISIHMLAILVTAKEFPFFSALVAEGIVFKKPLQLVIKWADNTSNRATLESLMALLKLNPEIYSLNIRNLRERGESSEADSFLTGLGTTELSELTFEECALNWVDLRIPKTLRKLHAHTCDMSTQDLPVLMDTLERKDNKEIKGVKDMEDVSLRALSSGGLGDVFSHSIARYKHFAFDPVLSGETMKQLIVPCTQPDSKLLSLELTTDVDLVALIPLITANGPLQSLWMNGRDDGYGESKGKAALEAALRINFNLTKVHIPYKSVLLGDHIFLPREISKRNKHIVVASESLKRVREYKPPFSLCVLKELSRILVEKVPAHIQSALEISEGLIATSKEEYTEAHKQCERICNTLKQQRYSLFAEFLSSHPEFKSHIDKEQLEATKTQGFVETYAKEFERALIRNREMGLLKDFVSLKRAKDYKGAKRFIDDHARLVPVPVYRGLLTPAPGL